MKKLSLLIFAAFILGVLFARFTVGINAVGDNYVNGFDHRCLQIKVKFNADSSWKQDGTNTIEVGCAGQGDITKKKFNPPGCIGGKTTMKPGDEITLGRCSCFQRPGHPETKDNKGCLVVGKKLKIDPRKTGDVWTYKRDVTVVKPIVVSDTCKIVYNDRSKTPPKKVSDENYFCGSNEQKFSAGIKINCRVPNTPTNTPTPTGVCPVPNPVLNVKITCPNCSPSPTVTPTITPTITPTPTVIPTITPTITPTPTKASTITPEQPQSGGTI